MIFGRDLLLLLFINFVTNGPLEGSLRRSMTERLVVTSTKYASDDDEAGKSLRDPRNALRGL